MSPTGTEPTQQQRPQDVPAGKVREVAGSAALREKARSGVGPCSYLSGAGGPEGLDEALEPLQHSAGAEHREPRQHDERQHLPREGKRCWISGAPALLTAWAEPALC